MKRGPLMMGLALAATLAAAWFAPPQVSRVAVVAAAEPPANRASNGGAARHASSTDSSEVLPIQARDGEEPDLGVFGNNVLPRRTARRPADLPVPLSAAAASTSDVPTMEELPFRMLGRYADGGEDWLLLQYRDQHLVVHAGDPLPEDHQLDSVSEHTATLVHMPSGTRRTIDLGKAP